MLNPKGLQDPKAVWNTKPGEFKNPLYYVCLVAANAVLQVIHCNHGTKAHSPCVFTLLAMYVVSIEEPFMRLYMAAWLGFVVYRRIMCDRREHRQFQGYPWLACMIPGVNTFHRGRIVEPFLVVGMAMWIGTYSRVVGAFFFASGVAVFLLFLIDKLKMERIRGDMTDAGVLGDAYRRIQEGQSGF